MNVDPVEAASHGILANTISTVDLPGGKTFHLNDDDIAFVMHNWQFNTSVTSVDLSLNGVGDAGAKFIAKAFMSNPTSALTRLVLDGNKITDDGAVALVHALPPTLTHLDISGNRISDETVGHIANAMKERRLMLKSLELRDNPLITNTSWTYLAEALKDSNCCLQGLHISGNAFNDGVLYLIGDIIRTNNSLTGLSLGNSGITDFSELIPSIEQNKSLVNITMGSDGRKVVYPEVDAVLRSNRRRATSDAAEIERLKAEHEVEKRRIVARYEQQLEVLRQVISRLQDQRN
jgi:hypothetical protein